VQLPANSVEGSVPNVAASGAATGIETGQQLPFSHAAAGVGRSIPTNATPSTAPAFSARLPEEAKSYPNKMFELSGFETRNCGNWRLKSSGNPCIRRSLVGVGAPHRRAAAGTPQGAALRPISFTQGARDTCLASSPRTVTSHKAQRTLNDLRWRVLPTTEILTKARTLRLAKYPKYISIY
jgi:hypothetical protein